MIEGKSERVAGIVIFIGILIFIIFSIKNADKYNDYKKTFKGETIGFVTRIEREGKRDYLKYYFYSDRKILSEVSSQNYGLVNKFYKVKYDLNNPEQNYIVLGEELQPDSLTLVKAGFTKNKILFL